MPPVARRSPGDGALFKRGDGMWVGSVEVPSADGKRRQKRVYSKTRSGCRDKLKELKDKVDGGLVIITGHDTLADWLDTWLNTIKKPRVTQSTYAFYEEAVRLHINPILGRTRLDKLTAQHVYHAINAANTTRNAQRVHLVVNMALKKAVDNGVLSRNVCSGIERPTHTTVEQDALTLAQADHLYRVAATHQPLMASRWAAALWTGARPAELRGLEWSRVDLNAKEFDLSWQLKQLKKTHGCGKRLTDGWPCGKTRVSACPQAFWDIAAGIEYRTCQGSLLWTRPKTDAGKRIVPIVEPLAEILALHYRDTLAQPNPHGLVWHWPDGRPIGEKQEWELWTALLDAAEVPRIDQYATRHTTATLLDELGVPQDVRMQIMGHSSKVAAKAYVHVDQTRARAALEKLAASFSPRELN